MSDCRRLSAHSLGGGVRLGNPKKPKQCVIPSVERGIWAAAPVSEGPLPDPSLDARNDTRDQFTTSQDDTFPANLAFSLWDDSPMNVSLRISAALLTLLFAVSCTEEDNTIRVGSKNFTESVLLAELLAQTLEASDCDVERRTNLGGTIVAHNAIEAGEIDAYVEYSGTALTAILKMPATSDPKAVDDRVRSEYAKKNLRWGPSLGFNNTFAMIIRKADASRRGLTTISDLRKVVGEFQPGFGPEFAARPDGYGGLTAAYGLRFSKPAKTMDLGLTYRALHSGQVDLIAGNSTDGLIESLGLVALLDDKKYFPPYDAAVVSRNDIDSKCGGAASALESLVGTLNEATMRRLNFEVDGRKRDPREVIREFLSAPGTASASPSVGTGL